MSNDVTTSNEILSDLKDFQVNTVNYVFEKFYGSSSTERFLVADQVGLGKTLVAKGTIAKILEELKKGRKHVDIIYVSSNTSIANQNVNRLNLSGNKEIAISTRLTMLPIQAKELQNNKVNFISFTPNTSFDLKKGGGRYKERIIIYYILKGTIRKWRKGLFNMLQGTKDHRNWKNAVCCWTEEIDKSIARQFRQKVINDTDLFQELTRICKIFSYNKNIFGKISSERYELIGNLRRHLAEASLSALNPKLVILDEFQRYKHLLDDNVKSKTLAHTLFNVKNVRILLLSATPYKFLSLRNEKGDSHYEDFFQTMKFLYNDNDDQRLNELKHEFKKYRDELMYLSFSNTENIKKIRNKLRKLLIAVMCRTEKRDIFSGNDPMLNTECDFPVQFNKHDVFHASVVDRIGKIVQASNRFQIDYWKSSPYLLNFLKNYELIREVNKKINGPPSVELIQAFKNADNHILKKDELENYVSIAPANGLMRTLLHDIKKDKLWRLLWIPPSLPYSIPSGAYKGKSCVTKSLIFSNWSLVPDAVSTICSYEAERRMIQMARSNQTSTKVNSNIDRILQLSTDKSNVHIKRSQIYKKTGQLLKFSKDSSNTTLNWMMPSITLASIIDPLKIALDFGKYRPVSKRKMFSVAESICNDLITRISVKPTDSRIDQTWHWIAPSLIDFETNKFRWLENSNYWKRFDGEDDQDEKFHKYVIQLIQPIKDQLALGRHPKNLSRVLTELSLQAVEKVSTKFFVSS